MPITAEHAISQESRPVIPMLSEVALARLWRDAGVVSVGISPNTRLDIAEQLLQGGESATRIVQGERGLYAVIFTPVDGLTEKEREMGQAAVRGAKRSLELAGRRSRTPEEEVKYLSKYKDAVIRASSVFDYSIVRLPDLPAGRPDQSPAVVDNVNNHYLLEDNNHTDRVRQHPLNAVLSGFVAFTTAGSAIPPSYPAPPAHVWHAAGETEPGIAIYEPKAPQQGPEEDWGGCGFFLKKEVTIVSSYYNTSSVLPAGTEVRVLGWTGDGRCHIEADGVQGFVPKDALSENLEPVFPITYTVLPGDTLWAIARAYGTTPQVIADLNGFKVDATIFPGQKLTLPTLGGVGGGEGQKINMELTGNFDIDRVSIYPEYTFGDSYDWSNYEINYFRENWRQILRAAMATPEIKGRPIVRVGDIFLRKAPPEWNWNADTAMTITEEFITFMISRGLMTEGEVKPGIYFGGHIWEGTRDVRALFSHEVVGHWMLGLKHNDPTEEEMLRSIDLQVGRFFEIPIFNTVYRIKEVEAPITENQSQLHSDGNIGTFGGYEIITIPSDQIEISPPN